jgi:RNA-directed DNA polymerase
VEERIKGTPQGGVISPLLANIFMHHAFDDWLRRNFPHIQFERYADDAVLHCVSLSQAEYVLEAIGSRMAEFGLELHPEKTQIVYCKDDDRTGEFMNEKFDFLGYTFRPRRARNRHGKFFVSFLPAISDKAAKSIRATIRGWQLGRVRTNQSLEEIARFVDPFVRGWMNYYGRFYRSAVIWVLRHLNRALNKWARRKYRRFRRRERAAEHWLGRVAKRDRNLFVLWRLGVLPAAGR